MPPRNRCTKAGVRWPSVASVPKPKYPMVGSFASCCARAASGHAAAPPSAASNSRRPMVTVIRPSRARCVKERIPRLQRAAFDAKAISIAHKSRQSLACRKRRVRIARRMFRQPSVAVATSREDRRSPGSGQANLHRRLVLGQQQ